MQQLSRIDFHFSLLLFFNGVVLPPFFTSRIDSSLFTFAFIFSHHHSLLLCCSCRWFNFHFCFLLDCVAFWLFSSTLSFSLAMLLPSRIHIHFSLLLSFKWSFPLALFSQHYSSIVLLSCPFFTSILCWCRVPTHYVTAVQNKWPLSLSFKKVLFITQPLTHWV